MSFFIAVNGSDIHYRRDSTSVNCRKASGVYICTSNDVCIKNREESNRMEWIVNGHSIKKNFILNGRSTSNIHLPTLIPCSNYARCSLKILSKIGFTTNGHYMSHISRCSFNNRHFDFCFSFCCLCTVLKFIKDFIFLLHEKILCLNFISYYFNSKFDGVEFNIGYLKRYFTRL